MPRRCFLEPTPEIYQAARYLDSAVDAHLSGNQTAATALIRKADMPDVSLWRQSIMGSVDPAVIRYRAVDDAPPYLPKDARINPRIPSANERRMIAERDGWHCRFCGMPVIDVRVRNAMRRAYPKALRWDKANAERHTALLCMWLQYDHVLPHSRGGDSSPENVIATCAPCNFGRGEYTLDEVGLIDPRTVPPVLSSWDGLERFLNA